MDLHITLWPWDDQHVLYVWVDALLAYMTASGFDLETYERGFSVDKHSEARDPLWERVTLAP